MAQIKLIKTAKGKKINLKNDHEKLHEPLVLKDAIATWRSFSWDIDFFASNFPDLEISIKVSPRLVTRCDEGCNDQYDACMETDCCYVLTNISSFVEWIKEESTGRNPLSRFCTSEYSCYADYKYMHELFPDNKSILEAVDWSTVGFNGRTGKESTLWIGSAGAFTPCHQDTYGYNVIAQIHGRKKWTLFSPEESSKLYPTRVPYEESSVFSPINIVKPDLERYPKFLGVTGYEVILEKGDILYVPKHWWHFVECMEPSISVNSWIDTDDDAVDRMNEALVRLMVFSLKRSDEEDTVKWLNPTEVETTHSDNLGFVESSVRDLVLKDSRDTAKDKSLIDTNLIIDSLSSGKVLKSLREEIFAKLNLPGDVEPENKRYFCSSSNYDTMGSDSSRKKRKVLDATDTVGSVRQGNVQCRTVEP